VGVKLISQTEVARRLGLTCAAVRTMDAQLKPIKVLGGGRVYPEKNVDRVAGQRDAKPRKKTVRK